MVVAVPEVAKSNATAVLEKVGALLYGDFTLASGRKSAYYFDSKMLTLHPEGSEFVARHLTAMVRGLGVEYVGGTAYGAIPMVSLVSLFSNLDAGPRIKGFYHRRPADVKGHGTQASVEGQTPNQAGEKVAILEDVVTSGDSLLRAIHMAEDEGWVVQDAVVLVDRNEGGREIVEERGYKLHSLFTVDTADGQVHFRFNRRTQPSE